MKVMKKRGNPNIAELGKATQMKPGCELWKQRKFFKYSLAALLEEKEIHQRYEVLEDGKVVKKVDKTIRYQDDHRTGVMTDTIARARAGDPIARKQIIDMIDGPAPQKLQHGGDPDNPTPISVIRLPSKDDKLGDE